MHMTLRWKLLPLFALGAAALTATAIPAAAGELAETEATGRSAPKAKNIEPPPAAALKLKLYEWGVDRVHWDGSEVSPNDVPDFYYSADEVALGSAREKVAIDTPEKPHGRGASCAKPVVYFESDKDGTFDFEVKFTQGTMDWMYPKPNRRTNAATAQWDNIRIVSNVDEAAKLPQVHDVKADHWANFSREGAQTLIHVNGESEHFLFYEGTKHGLVDADVAQDTEGNIVLRNFGPFPIHDVHLRLPCKDGWSAWFVREIAAANGGNPTTLTLGDANRVELESVRKPGMLSAEVKQTGLTDSQAAVFERCWRDDFLMGDNAVLTWRHDPRKVNSTVVLKATGATLESNRACYVWVGNIDLSRQGEMEKLAEGVATDDDDAADKLAKFGMAGFGAARRLMSDGNQSLARRMQLAKWLKKLSRQK